MIGAEVEVHFYGPVSGVAPSAQKTNERGVYTITTPAYGKGVISASKQSEGYPNAAMAYYEQEARTSLKRVNLLASTRLRGVNLTLGNPDAVVKFEIVSRGTQKAVGDARIQISLATQPEICGSYTVPPNGIFSFVLPDRPVKVKVTAPGFAEWSYATPQGAPTLMGRPGEHKIERIVLNRK